MTLKFKNSTKLRNQLIRKQHILSLQWYRKLYNQVKNLKSPKRIKALKFSVANQTKNKLKDDMGELCQSLIQEANKTGYEFDENLLTDVMENVLSGDLYNNDWTLDAAVVKIDEKTQYVITTIIESGIENGKTEEEILEDVLAAIDPDNLQYQHSYTVKHKTLYVGKLEALTERLMRTTLEHTFQAAIREIAKEIQSQSKAKTMIRWISALEPNTCEVCESRHNKLYTPEELPLEHPNGQCEFFIEYA